MSCQPLLQSSLASTHHLSFTYKIRFFCGLCIKNNIFFSYLRLNPRDTQCSLYWKISEIPPHSFVLGHQRHPAILHPGKVFCCGKPGAFLCCHLLYLTLKNSDPFKFLTQASPFLPLLDSFSGLSDIFSLQYFSATEGSQKAKVNCSFRHAGLRQQSSWSWTSSVQKLTSGQSCVAAGYPA